MASIFRVHANNSVICKYFSIGFIGFMLAGKKLSDLTSLLYKVVILLAYDFEKNDNVILSYFKDE